MPKSLLILYCFLLESFSSLSPLPLFSSLAAPPPAPPPPDGRVERRGWPSRTTGGVILVAMPLGTSTPSVAAGELERDEVDANIEEDKIKGLLPYA